MLFSENELSVVDQIYGEDQDWDNTDDESEQRNREEDFEDGGDEEKSDSHEESAPADGEVGFGIASVDGEGKYHGCGEDCCEEDGRGLVHGSGARD